MNDHEALTLLFRTLERFNESLPAAKRLPLAADTPLMGSDSLDSLGLTNLLVSAEQDVEEALGTPVTLLDERLLTEEPSPLATVGTLAGYIRSRLETGPDARS